MPIDYKKYPPNWKTEIRPRVLSRANNCCEFCRVGNGREINRFRVGDLNLYRQANKIYCAISGDCFGRVDDKIRSFILGHKLIKIVLTIAHLDHDETNWDVKDDRLAALCQRCHIHYDIEEKKKRVKNK